MSLMPIVAPTTPPPATSYSNTLGSGDRTGTITATMLLAGHTSPTDGTLSNLVDGGTGNNSTDSLDSTGNDAANDFFKFNLGSQKYFDEVRFKKQTTTNLGTWKVRGSNDDSAWTDLSGTFTWNSLTQTVPCAMGPTEKYQYVEWLCTVGGVAVGADWFQEFELKVEA